jgi:hypothetical protein
MNYLEKQKKKMLEKEFLFSYFINKQENFNIIKKINDFIF